MLDMGEPIKQCGLQNTFQIQVLYDFNLGN